MFFYSTLLAVLALASSVTAQPSPTAYVEPTVPTGKPIAGNYGGALRPQIHFSPPKDFMVSFATVPVLRPVLNYALSKELLLLGHEKQNGSSENNENSEFSIPH